MKKKVFILFMCLSICFALGACSLGDGWIDDAAKEMGNSITTGEIYIDGDVFTFPMNVSDFLDKGWHLSKSYSNIETYELEPDNYSTEFEIWKDDIYVKVSAINMSDKNATVKDCMVQSLKVTETKVDFVLPGGLSKRSSMSDVEDKYGKADKTEAEKDYLENWTYDFSSKDGYSCQVKLEIWNDGKATYPLSSVTYNLTAISGDVSLEETVRTFVDSAMKTSYCNDYKEYVGNLYDTEQGAQELYLAEVDYYTAYLLWYVDVNSDYITEDIKNQFTDIAKTVLSKAKWEIGDIDVDEKSETGTLTLEIYPISYTELIDEKVDAVIDIYNAKYANTDFDSMSDEEYAEVEIEYANMILEAIKGIENDTTNAGKVIKEYEITGDSILTDDQWEEIDDLIMGISKSDS